MLRCVHVTVSQYYAFLLWVIDNCGSWALATLTRTNVVHHHPLLHRTEMVRNTKSLDIRGQSLKLDTAEDVVPLLEGFDPASVEEVHLGGNTIGVEAAQEFAKFLKKTQNLKVFSLSRPFSFST